MKRINLNDLDIQAMNMLEMEEQNGGSMSIGGRIVCTYAIIGAASLATLLAVTGGTIYVLVKHT